MQHFGNRRKLRDGAAGRAAIAVLLVASLIAIAPVAARAAAITVTSLDDTGASGICVLRDAITAANSVEG